MDWAQHLEQELQPIEQWARNRRRQLNEAVTKEGTQAIARVQWYDEETAKRVVALFANDFDAYNFSTDPANKFD